MNKEGAVILELKNEGNVHLEPKANIEITDIFNNYVASLENVSLKISPPRGGITLIPVIWKNPSLFGRFTAHVTVLFGNDQSATHKISFWMFPWAIPISVAILIIILIFGKLFWRLHYAKTKLKMIPYKMTKKENLIEIADRLNVSWKKLARINNLKSPYTLKRGETLFIPQKKEEKKK